MADNQWGEIFNLTEELKRIEEEVDKRLEETLAEDPHVIEQETVHYGAAAAEDRTERYRMRQSVPLFAPLGRSAVEPGAAKGLYGDLQEQAPSEDAQGQTQAGAGAQNDGTQDHESQMQAESRDADAEVREAAAAWDESPVDDYTAPRATEPEDPYAVMTDGEPVEAQTTDEAGQGSARVYAFAMPGASEEQAASVERASAAEESRVASAVSEAEPDEKSFAGESLAEETVPETMSEAVAAEPAAVQEESTPPVMAATDSPVPESAGEDELPEAPAEEPEEETPVQETATDVKGRAETQRGQGLQALLQDRRKVLAVLIAVIVVLAGILGYRYYQDHVRHQRQYSAAEALYKSGDYDGAVAAFAEIKNYKDASTRILEVEYAKASALVDQKAYAAAIEYVDNLSEPTDAMLTLRSHAIYELAMLYYQDGDLENATGELLLIPDYEQDGVKATDLLHQIQYQQAADALAVYDYDTAEPILAALGDYEDAEILLWQVQNAIDEVYTDVARDDNGKEIKGKTEYLWVHSVITPGATSSDPSEEQTTQLRELAGATDAVDDDAIHVLMMHRATTDAEMTYEDAEPIETDSSTIITKDVSSYAAIDDTFGKEQTVYSPQALQRSNTDYALSFDGSETYAAKDRKDDEVVMECKMADDAYWVKTRRVYAELEDDKFIGVSKHQLRTWTKVLNETIADEVRAAFLANTN